ncbi:MAG: hypothetical protein JST75_09295 [Bacteroidetes bacterium]|nr:hypothetical protein [Bacteroidota bacterium]
MASVEKKIIITFEGKQESVEVMTIQKRKVYLVRFSNQAPIMVTQASDGQYKKFWTVIPENPSRQKFAEVIGALIEEQIKKPPVIQNVLF